LDEIPISYQCISSEWLTRAICSNTPGAQVISHSLDASDEGTTNRRRIFLQYNDIGVKAGLPSSVFCKATQSLESRLLLGLNGCVEREVDFYRRVRPVLDIEAPSAIFANVNLESRNSIIVLRDMKGSAEFCSESTPMSLQHAKNQMRLLAKVHGTFSRKSAHGAMIRHYSTIGQFFETTQNATDWMDACNKGFSAAKAVVPGRLYPLASTIWPATMRAVAQHDELPETLIHSDVHLKNWYITAGGEMGLGDWQCCVKGHWSRDLAYTISTALTVEHRRAWEGELIRYYLDQLASAGGDVMTVGEVMPLYRQQMLTALAMWTGTYTPAAGTPNMQPEATSIEFIKRITQAMDDLNSLEAC
jgi:aminoglycoside phosphotransferase (APT) family kinase protein